MGPSKKVVLGSGNGGVFGYARVTIFCSEEGDKETGDLTCVPVRINSVVVFVVERNGV